MTDRVMTASGVAQLQQLIAKWRRAARDYRSRQYNALTWQAIALEVERCADELEAALLAVDAPPPQAEEPWHPIATAPKDGRPLLLSTGTNVVHGYWGLYDRWHGCDPTDFTYSSPTHWMPLPAPPRPTRQEGSEP